MKFGFVVLLAFVSVFTACSGGVKHPVSDPSGKQLFFSRTRGGCAVCHKITEKKFVGPGLAGVSKKHSDEWLTAWIKDPRTVWSENNPETVKMKKRLGKEDKELPGMKLLKPLSDREANALVKYLKTL